MRRWTGVLSLAALGLIACRSASLPPQPWTTVTVTRGPASGLEDGQIAELANSMDVQQIEAARLGVLRAADPDARDFARALLDECKRLRGDGLGLLEERGIALEASSVSEQYEVGAREELAALGNQPPSLFDRAFVESQIAAETRQLELLDHLLAPAARDGRLRADLARRRRTLVQRRGEAEHLLVARFPRQ